MSFDVSNVRATVVPAPIIAFLDTRNGATKMAWPIRCYLFLFHLAVIQNTLDVFQQRSSENSKLLSSDPEMMKKIVIVITSGILVTEGVWQLYKIYRRSQRKDIHSFNGCTKQVCKNTETKIFEVMFFSKDSALCRPHLIDKKSCEKLNCAVGHLRRIIDYLDSATDTLDICIYFFTCPELAEAIIKAKNRKVVIRMILDKSMAENDTSQIINFIKAGIKPKSKQLDVLMHHKFVIIDNNILISGSINWTRSAFFGNFENALMTNEPAIVKPFINEFERIWTMLQFNSTTAEVNSNNLNIHQ